MDLDILEKLEPAEKRFGMDAIEKGFITKDQLLNAMKTQVEEELEHGARRFIGSILVEMKAINLEKLPPAEKRFGMVAVEKGYITKDQLLDALRMQIEEDLEKGTHRFIGAILVDKKLINTKQLRSVILSLGLGQGN